MRRLLSERGSLTSSLVFVLTSTVVLGLMLGATITGLRSHMSLAEQRATVAVTQQLGQETLGAANSPRGPFELLAASPADLAAATTTSSGGRTAHLLDLRLDDDGALRGAFVVENRAGVELATGRLELLLDDRAFTLAGQPVDDAPVALWRLVEAGAADL